MEARRAIFGIITVCCGLALFLLRVPFTRAAIRTQQATWGFRYDERAYRAGLFAVTFVAMAAVVLGILVLLGVAKLK